MKTSELKQKITPVPRKHSIRHAAVFGSVSRGEDRLGSDIDILVRLGKPMGMFSYMCLIGELEDKLGRKVDLLTENGISKFIRPYIIADLKTIYED